MGRGQGFCGNSTYYYKQWRLGRGVKICQKLGDVIYVRTLSSSKFDNHLLDADTSVDVVNMTFEGNVFDGEDDI